MALSVNGEGMISDNGSKTRNPKGQRCTPLNSSALSILKHSYRRVVSFLNHELFTAVACTMSNTVSPMPKNLSATPRIVGSDTVSEFSVKPLDRRTPAMTVDNKTASTA